MNQNVEVSFLQIIRLSSFNLLMESNYFNLMHIYHQYLYYLPNYFILYVNNNLSTRMKHLISLALCLSSSILFGTITIDTPPMNDSAFDVCVPDNPQNFQGFIDFLQNNGSGLASSDCGTVISPWNVASVTWYENSCGEWDAEVEWEVSDDCGSNPVMVSAFYSIFSPNDLDLVPPIDLDINECVLGDPMAHPVVVDYFQNNGYGYGNSVCGTYDIVLVYATPTNYGCSIFGIEAFWELYDICDDEVLFTHTSLIMITPEEFPNFTSAPTDINIDCDDPNYQMTLDNWLDNLGGATVGGCLTDHDTIITFTPDLTCPTNEPVLVQFEITGCGTDVTEAMIFFQCDTCPPPIDTTSFITTWETTTNNESITIPTKSGSIYDYFIDWGDGGTDEGVTGSISHVYATPGLHEIKISGQFPRMFFNNLGDKDKILSIDQWGAIQWTSLAHAFKGCSKLNILATDAPDLSEATSMSATFKSCTTLNNDLNHWDVSNIERMDFLFEGASTFNQDLGSWNTGNVTNMQSLFKNASNFNQDVSQWNFSQVTNMTRIFSNSGLSTENYDTFLATISCDANIQSGVPFGAQGIKFCKALSSRDQLQNIHNWTIDDAGLVPDCDQQIIWEGNIDTNWLDCENWTQKIIPSSQSNVLIPAGRTQYPIIVSGSDTLFINLLTVEFGAVLDIMTGANFVVNADD